MKVVINSCYGGFGLSKEAYKELGLAWDNYGYEYSDYEKRNDPKLVEVIEKLGEVASGDCANLRIVEIPDNINWTITDYDGFESVEEAHRSWM